MTTAYFYAAVQCPDPRAFAELRTVGAVLIAPEARFGGVASIPLERKLAPGGVALVRQVLGLWQQQVEELAGAGSEGVIEWMNARAVGTEDAVRLSAPAFGLTEDPKRELERLKTELTGYRPVVVRTPTEKWVSQVLRSNGLGGHFRPAVLPAGPASYRFPLVHGSHVVHPVEFHQQKAAAVLDAAWRDAGRFQEVRHALPSLDALVVTPRPVSSAIERAHDIYREVRLHVVYAEAAHVEAGLQRWGLLAGSASAK